MTTGTGMTGTGMWSGQPFSDARDDEASGPRALRWGLGLGLAFWAVVAALFLF